MVSVSAGQIIKLRLIKYYTSNYIRHDKVKSFGTFHVSFPTDINVDIKLCFKDGSHKLFIKPYEKY